MKIFVAVFCLAALACLEGVNSQDGQAHHRERVPLGRFVSPDDLRQRSHRIPRGPPVRVTNGHTGHEEGADSVRPNVVSARSLDITNPPQRRVRRVRKRRPDSRQLPAPNTTRVPRLRRPASRHISQSVQPDNYRFARKIVEETLKNVQGTGRLIQTRGNYPHVPLVDKLIDNATLIRPVLTEGFDCKGRTYGYYADQLNDCQVFHICIPMKQIFPDHFHENDIYHFSFICPEFTIFTQDAMVCAMAENALSCNVAHQFYHMNQNFFMVSNDDVQKETTPGYGQTVVESRPPPTPRPYPTRPPPAIGAYTSQPLPVAAGTYQEASGGVSSAATAAPPPPPSAYPTPGQTRPPPPPAAYPIPGVPQATQPPPPPAYPTPSVPQPSPPPAAYPVPGGGPQVQPQPLVQPNPQVQPQPQTQSPIVGYPSQRSETIETLPDTTQPDTTQPDTTTP